MFKQNGENPKDIGTVGQSAMSRVYGSITDGR